MKVGLIDVDGHRFPNLALMRISAWHKAQGDTVEWWIGDIFHYDRVYMSKIFSGAYSQDIPEPLNTDEVIKGGTGYAIYKDSTGRERLDQKKNTALPTEVERMFPDYSIYPQYDFAIAMTSRGCPRGCPWCHVADKEGRRSVKVADVSDFFDGRQKHIECLDPNILACPDKKELLAQYQAAGVPVNYNQGLDIRLMTEDDLRIINETKIKEIHFAWDNSEEDLLPRFKWYADKAKIKRHGSFGTVYVLTNFGSAITDDLRRIYSLAELGFDPYVMIYDKPNAPAEIKRLQRWCNNKIIFKRCPRWEDYR